MAVYRGMDIGTAKPSRRVRDAVPHHLIDIRDPWEEFSVAEYLELAREVVDDIRARGREIVFVGGTPLYLKVLLRGLDDVPSANWEFRRQVEEEARQLGDEALYARVQQIDPVAAAALHPGDTRRLIRVLEVYAATGSPLSHLQMTFEEEGHAAEDCRVFVLRRPRSQLHQRIDQRVDRMLREGLVDEVRGLLRHPRGLGRTASQAVGYCEVVALLEDRQVEAQAAAQMKQRTRRFAKRQETWFRSLQECRFVDLDEDAQADQVAETILEQASG